MRNINYCRSVTLKTPYYVTLYIPHEFRALRGLFSFEQSYPNRPGLRFSPNFPLQCSVPASTMKLPIAADIIPMTPTDPKSRSLRRAGLLNPHPERVQDPAFQDSPFFDPRDLLQVRYEMLRLVERGEASQTEAARRFGVTRMTFHRARAAFAEHGLTGLVPAKRGPRGPRKITPEIRRFAHDYRRRHGRVGATRLARAIKDKFGLRLHPRTLERALPRRAKKNDAQEKS